MKFIATIEDVETNRLTDNGWISQNILTLQLHWACQKILL